jgi:hypothetical protein
MGMSGTRRRSVCVAIVIYLRFLCVGFCMWVFVCGFLCVGFWVVWGFSVVYLFMWSKVLCGVGLCCIICLL